MMSFGAEPMLNRIEAKKKDEGNDLVNLKVVQSFGNYYLADVGTTPGGPTPGGPTPGGPDNASYDDNSNLKILSNEEEEYEQIGMYNSFGQTGFINSNSSNNKKNASNN